MPKTTEYEINYFPIKRDEVLESFENIPGASLLTPNILQKRWIFTIPPEADVDALISELKPFVVTGDLDSFKDLLPSGDYLRIRVETSDKTTMSVKIHAKSGGKMSDQQEAELMISEYEKPWKILLKNQFLLKNYQENYRETWQIMDCTALIDQWPGLKPHVEIEGKSEEQVMRLAETLGFTSMESNGKISSTYASVSYIYAQTFGITQEEMLEVKILTFDKLPAWVKPFPKNNEFKPFA